MLAPGLNTLGVDGGPAPQDHYKRAVYKKAPPAFSVLILPPQKIGNHHSYGMRITPVPVSHSPVASSRHSTYSSSTSTTTTTVNQEYEIWRRWEDCLTFQDDLESNYARMAREKRARLLAGKGVKRNGVYTHSDPWNSLQRAASFESLPPGPDPRMIAKDIHEVLPRLTKKGTLFRAKQETIEQRGREFERLITALLREGDDVPTLIVDLRNSRVIRDFFGFWRRDHDRVKKAKDMESKQFAKANASSVSIRSSMFGSSLNFVFSASNLTLQAPPPMRHPEASQSALSVNSGFTTMTETSSNSAESTTTIGSPQRNRPLTYVDGKDSSPRPRRPSDTFPVASGSGSRHGPSSRVEGTISPAHALPTSSANSDTQSIMSRDSMDDHAPVSFTFTLHSSSSSKGHEFGDNLSDTISLDAEPAPRPLKGKSRSTSPLSEIPAHSTTIAEEDEEEEPIELGGNRQSYDDVREIMREHQHIFEPDTPLGLQQFTIDEEAGAESDASVNGTSQLPAAILPARARYTHARPESTTLPSGRPWSRDSTMSKRQGFIFLPPQTPVTLSGSGDEVSDKEDDDVPAPTSHVILPETDDGPAPIPDDASVRDSWFTLSPNAGAGIPESVRASVATMYTTTGFSTFGGDGDDQVCFDLSNLSGWQRRRDTQTTMQSALTVEPESPPRVPSQLPPPLTIPNLHLGWQRRGSGESELSDRSSSSSPSEVVTWEGDDEEEFFEAYLDGNSPRDHHHGFTPGFTPITPSIPSMFPAPPGSDSAFSFRGTSSKVSKQIPFPSPGYSPEDTLTVKAILRQGTESIVALRIDRSLPLVEVRGKVRDKFASLQPEGISISEDFSIAYKLPAGLVSPVSAYSPSICSDFASARERSASMYSDRSSVPPSLTSDPSLRHITSEHDWQEAVSASSSKLTLYILA